MHDMRPQRQAQPVVKVGPEAGLSVVEPASFVDRNQYVVIDMAGVGIFGSPVLGQAHRAQNAPRTWAKEVFPRYRSKRLHNTGIADRGRAAELFGIALSCRRDRIGPRLAPGWRSGDVRCTGIENPAQVELVSE